ncbi:N-alpha-acetyltransferase 80-like [Patiria miniata]|uniref:N-acetyltransferase domain-containing protein n=1 Tax=Patiria miniata TaxID=46514 RepID=A0A914B6S5_PATMI|nr:N-alpha-acetyltransferase 80-like [Patiria miniata]XP_038071823.1 N-alpha-acetyltransferase 80-like [Patiria miniata]
MNADTGIHMEPLHRRPDLMDASVELLNAQWPRSKAARLHSLDKSCEGLPYSLVMVNANNAVIGYCRLAKVISVPSSVLIESVVVPENLRGRGLGRRVMDLAESHAKRQGFTTMYLSTKDKQDFYAHLGYEFCKAVNTLDAQMIETCDAFPAGCNSTSLKSAPCSMNSKCSARDNQPTSGCQQVSGCDCPKPADSISDGTGPNPDPKSETDGSAPSENVPPAPPPPPVKVSKTPATVVYWMKKEVT